MEASEEQKKVIEAIENNNVIVDSVAGSGKTTTNIFIAKKYPNKKILLLTFNRKLSDETKERLQKENIKNLEVYTYHGFCCKNYIETHDDEGIQKSLNLKCKNVLEYDIIIIDEAQDINELFYNFICNILIENLKEYSLCILGDKNQSIYEFMGADNRYLTMADKIFNLNKKNWVKLKLSTSYRMTKQMAEFMNKCILNEERIISTKEGKKPEYFIMDSFKIHEIIGNVLHNDKIKPDDIFILAPSVKGKKTLKETPLSTLENYLVNKNINIYIPSSDDEKISEDVTNNKLVFSSFHQSKGLERKVVICYGFDSSYYEFYGKNLSTEYCPNILYVALTRAKERLIIIQNKINNIMPFINTNNMDECCNCFKSVNIKAKAKNNDIEFKNRISCVTDFVRFLSQEFMTKLLDDYVEEIEINEKTRKINIDNTQKFISNGKEIIESVSEINGTMIPMYYEYLTKKNINAVEILKNIHSSKPIGNNCSNNDNINIFGSDLEFIHNIDMNNLKISEMLKISNYFNCYQTKYIHKIKQIKKYNWINEAQIKKCVSRMKKIIGKNAKYEIRVSKDKYLNDKNLVGFIDCIDDKNIYEFKFVGEIKHEHKIQLCIYIYLFCSNNNIKTDDEMNKYNYYLFNIKNNNLIQFKSTYEKICKMYDEIINYKLNGWKKKTDEEFIMQYENKFCLKNTIKNESSIKQTKIDVSKSKNESESEFDLEIIDDKPIKLKKNTSLKIIKDKSIKIKKNKSTKIINDELMIHVKNNEKQ
jgi:hypothetical protein